ncbi:MAG: hypothetical protein ACREDR_11610 [Blastocatellia bacterium]
MNSQQTLSPDSQPVPPPKSNILKCDFMALATIIGIGPASTLFSSRPVTPVIRETLLGRGTKVCVRMVCTPDALHAEVVDAPPAGKTGPLLDLFKPT